MSATDRTAGSFLGGWLASHRFTPAPSILSSDVLQKILSELRGYSEFSDLEIVIAIGDSCIKVIDATSGKFAYIVTATCQNSLREKISAETVGLAKNRKAIRLYRDCEVAAALIRCPENYLDPDLRRRLSKRIHDPIAKLLIETIAA